MKITDMKCAVIAQSPVIRITTDEGIVGWGQIETPKPYLQPVVMMLKPALIGKDPTNVERIMRTKYRIDTFQKTYFVIDSFEQLMQATSPDFTPIYAALANQAHLPAGEVQGDDRVFQKGTGEGWADGGDV